LRGNGLALSSISGEQTAQIADQKPLARGRKSARKRSAIIHAAIEIINEKSYALATMTEIAASLDLRDAALYYYFPSKQALAYACHVYSLEIFDRLLQDAERAGGTGLSKLQHFIHGMLHDAEIHGPQLYFGDYSYLDSTQRDTVKQWADKLTAVLEQFLHQGMADGSVVPCEPKIVIQLLLGMLIWLAKWVPAVEGMTVDRLMKAIGVVSLNGLSGSPTD
jgi:AcrR family transcriptional regulator